MDDVSTKEYQRQFLAEALEEYKRDNPVLQNIKYHYFTSKSKGRRNGKHVYATEIIGQFADGEMLKEAVMEFEGGKRW